MFTFVQLMKMTYFEASVEPNTKFNTIKTADDNKCSPNAYATFGIFKCECIFVSLSHTPQSIGEISDISPFSSKTNCCIKITPQCDSIAYHIAQFRTVLVILARRRVTFFLFHRHTVQ